MIGSEFWQAVATVFVPLAALFVPGAFAVQLADFHDLLFNGARVMLWSISSLIVGTFLAVFLHIPMMYIAALIVLVSIGFVTARHRNIFQLSYGWTVFAIIIPIVLGYALFAVPFFLKHDGLPSGDSQKAIFWAQDILARNRLPEYTTAPVRLNRDPGDFFTPGLHTFTALIMRLSPQPLVAVGLMSIVLAVATAWIAAAISKELFDDFPHLIPPLLSAAFVLTNFRFLRYLREPGYHYQNIVGEFLLFGLMLIALRCLQQFTRRDALLCVLLVTALVLSHQFSVFVGVFFLLPLAVIFWFTHRSPHLTWATGVIVAILAVAAIPFGLYAKLPHLLTATPHLTGLTPALADYPLTMGSVWFIFGTSGLLLLTLYTFRFGGKPRWAFIGGTLGVLALSQGPNWHLDIPPVRALFYTVVPLSICAAYLVMNLRHFIDRTYIGWLRPALLIFLAIVVIAPATSSTLAAYDSSQHQAAVNSTLTADQEYLVQYLASSPRDDAVLIDDYNRRSASWLVLSGKPMFTRIASNIEQEMNEAGQGELRKGLYVQQLDFEKIYSLASRPEVAQLMAAHAIGWVAGIEGTSEDGFSHNSALREAARAGDIVLFEPVNTSNARTNLSPWLLRASTLVNDIGDGEDTFLHLPASVRSVRLSEPQVASGQTFRTTSAPIIPLAFNVRSYVQALWNQDQATQSDTSLEFLIETAFGPASFTLRTASGKVYTVTPGQPVKLNPEDVPLNDKGAIQLDLINPTEELVGIDLIALGSARTP